MGQRVLLGPNVHTEKNLQFTRSRREGGLMSRMSRSDDVPAGPLYERFSMCAKGLLYNMPKYGSVTG